MPLKALVGSIKPKIIGPKIDRETIKRVMDDIYQEIGNLTLSLPRPGIRQKHLCAGPVSAVSATI
jgi:hypothetical protein